MSAKWTWNKCFPYPKSKREVLEGLRHYDVVDGLLPSVTTILSDTKSEEKQRKLAEWRERVGQDEATRITDQSGQRGTIMHNYLEGYLKGQNRLDLSPVGVVAGGMATKVMEEGVIDRLTEIWGSEVVVFYPGLYAGQTDVVGIYDGEQAIVDFKQSNKPKKREWIDDYFMQSAAYAMAHNQIYGTNISKGVILVCTPDLYFQRFVVEGAEFQDYAKQWLAKVATFYAKRQEKGIQNPKTIDLFQGK